MEIIHRFFSFLAKLHTVYYIFVGVAVMYLFNRLDMHPSKDLIRESVWIFAPAWVLNFWATKFFYADKINDVGDTRIGIPSDPYFYHTVISDIGTPRKIAGYAYVISKAVLFCLIGSGFFIVGLQIFQK